MADPSLLPQPPGYQCPFDDQYLAVLNEAISLEQTQMYKVQQAGLCEFPVEQFRADSERRLRTFRLLKQHFFPGCP